MIKKLPAPEVLAAVDRAWMGREIRYFRSLFNVTQGELASRAEVTITTVFRAERGDATRWSTIQKLCDALNVDLEQLITRRPIATKTEDRSYVLHSAEGQSWFAHIDHRKNVSKENVELTQSPEERRRVGALGLVPTFACYLNLIMPDGPGATLIELYGHFPHPFNHELYRECMIYCQRGSARLQIRDDVLELKEGDFVGFSSADMRWMEPTRALLPDEAAPLLLWFGAVRVGKVSRKRGERTTVRKPANPGPSPQI